MPGRLLNRTQCVSTAQNPWLQCRGFSFTEGSLIFWVTISHVATDLSDFLDPGRAVKAAKITDHMVVADFGVGAGFFTRAIARAVGPQGRVYAIDINRDLLQRLAPLCDLEGLKNIDYVRGDLDEVKGSGLADASVDIVMMANILFQVEKKDLLLEEAHRILRRGGRLILIDWKESFNNLGPHEGHVVNRAAALALLNANNGFAHVEDIPAGSFHYGLILKKQ